MELEDEEATTFRTLKIIFYYKVMPFGLKNAIATYQWVMTHIFKDLLHDAVECYVDNLLVKTRMHKGHLLDLNRVFKRLQQYGLKMNPLKCTFGVSSGKFMGFIVKHRGIEIDPKKITAIKYMFILKDISELKCLQGCLAYI